MHQDTLGHNTFSQKTYTILKKVELIFLIEILKNDKTKDPSILFKAAYSRNYLTSDKKKNLTIAVNSMYCDGQVFFLIRR